MLQNNPLREKLGQGQVVYGAFCGIASPDIIEMLGYAGCDFVIIDGEHGAIGIETIQMLVTAAHAAGTVPLVRVNGPDPRPILQALDVGAFGIHVPTVTTREQAERCVQAARYFPLGNRGMFGSGRAAQYGLIPPAEYMRWANEQPLVILAIESKEGVKNLTEILAVPGIDILFIGPADLSQSLGIPFQMDNPLLVDTMSEIIAKARQAKLVVGTNVGAPEQAALWWSKGVQLISFSVNGVISRGLRGMVQTIRTATGSVAGQ
jgi:4-hydroxy-2-oxoheptanedioate aldolase